MYCTKTHEKVHTQKKLKNRLPSTNPLFHCIFVHCIDLPGIALYCIKWKYIKTVHTKYHKCVFMCVHCIGLHGLEWPLWQCIIAMHCFSLSWNGLLYGCLFVQCASLVWVYHGMASIAVHHCLGSSTLMEWPPRIIKWPLLLLALWHTSSSIARPTIISDIPAL